MVTITLIEARLAKAKGVDQSVYIHVRVCMVIDANANGNDGGKSSGLSH